jgi:diaminopimelate decarboxylase|tara:strand:- start:11504 stop:12589 length:1086 start_codon:yes stop_codon:yes gene_type:complete
MLHGNVDALKAASKPHGFHVHYAIKSNANSRILELISETGLGADCVSGNEIKASIESGFSPDKVVFAGVGKSDKEINYALEKNIFCFNCESIQEIEVINELAEKQDKVAKIAIRLNPNVNAYTHAYITTGLEENKFGINASQLEEVLEVISNSENIKLIGLHFHIGSQITDLTPFKNLCNKINELQQWFLTRNVTIEHINVGGGLGIDYETPDLHPIPAYEEYFQIFKDFLELQSGQEVHFELGRSITGNMGTLVSRVLYVKKGINTNFLILDAGMTELIRPALYQSYHKIENLSKRHLVDISRAKYDVVGPICESSDCFGKDVTLEETERGDLIGIRSAGAYGEVMASSYNLREKAKVLF